MSAVILGAVRRPGDREPVDVVVASGRIVRISPTPIREEADAPGGNAAARVDFGGLSVIPGLWDEHVHTTQWAVSRRRLDLAQVTSARDAARVVGAAARAAVAGPDGLATVVAGGFFDATWPDAPSLALLDAETGDRPAALISNDLHCVWVNSAAAARYALAVDASGLLREGAAFELTRALTDLPTGTLDRWVAEAAAHAAARGIVGIVDFEMTWNAENWRRRTDAGFDALRVDAGVYAADLDRAHAEGLRSGGPLGDALGLLTVGPMKVLIDGSLNTRTAFCSDPYPHGGHGLLTVQAPELLELLRAAKAHGFLPAVHAIGDEANRIALDAFEAAGLGGRIEHAQLVRPGDFARFASLGITASVQPRHAIDDRDVADLNWSGRTDLAFPMRSYLDAGAVLAFGSDAPVAPLDPWTTMAAATTRDRGDGRAPWHPEQTVTRVQALEASARGRSRVEVGDVADLAILGLDPLTAPAAGFAAMPVVATLVGGRFTHGGDDRA